MAVFLWGDGRVVLSMAKGGRREAILVTPTVLKILLAERRNTWPEITIFFAWQTYRF